MDQVKDPAVALNALQEAFAETSHDPYIIKDLTATLERIMRDCSLANIEVRIYFSAPPRLLHN